MDNMDYVDGDGVMWRTVEYCGMAWTMRITWNTSNTQNATECTGVPRSGLDHADYLDYMDNVECHGVLRRAVKCPGVYGLCRLRGLLTLPGAPWSATHSRAWHV